MTTLAVVPCSSPHCLIEFRANIQFHVQIQAHRATWDAKASMDHTGPPGNPFPFRAAVSQMPQTALQGGIYCLCAVGWYNQCKASEIREARSVSSLPNSIRHCTNKQQITQESLLTLLMIQSMKRPNTLTVCLDPSCLQGQHPQVQWWFISKLSWNSKRNSRAPI